MKVNTPDDAPEEVEVLLYCHAGGDQVRVLARLHWFTEAATDKTQERVQAWQETWSGSRLPAEWIPYAWLQPETPDPGA